MRGSEFHCIDSVAFPCLYTISLPFSSLSLGFFCPVSVAKPASFSRYFVLEFWVFKMNHCMRTSSRKGKTCPSKTIDQACDAFHAASDGKEEEKERN